MGWDGMCDTSVAEIASIKLSEYPLHESLVSEFRSRGIYNREISTYASI